MAAAQGDPTTPQLEKSDSSRPESDIEKALSSDGSSEEEISPYVEQRQAEEARDVTTFRGKLAAFTIRLSQYGVETRGVVPTAPEARTDTRFWNLLFLWISANFNILAFSTGSLGPAIFALGLKESLLVIFFINLLSATLPAYFSTFGPRLGMRQMIVSRYSFGFYGNIIPSLLNLITFMGFLILNLILGGETLAAVSGYQAGHGGGLSWDIGIAIVGVIALLASHISITYYIPTHPGGCHILYIQVTFCGYKVLYTYERFAWIPIVMVYIVALGCGGKQLTDLAPVVPASSVTVLCFAASIAGYMISWSTLASDYTIYLDQSAPNSKVFLFAYSGFFFPNVICEMVGAAFAVSMHAPGNEAWLDGYKVNNVGGLLDEVMRPAGGSIPLAMVGAHTYYTSLISFTGVIGYWAAAWASIVLAEHVLFRQSHTGAPETAGYDSAAWNDPSALPTGIPALAAFALSFALIVPAMNQVWFQGPIGRRVGDIGFELAFMVAGGLYSVFRHVEKKVCVGRAAGLGS
ncbi:purine-cytosine permease (2.A.39) family, partial [Rhizoctonia solani]